MQLDMPSLSATNANVANVLEHLRGRGGDKVSKGRAAACKTCTAQPPFGVSRPCSGRRIQPRQTAKAAAPMSAPGRRTQSQRSRSARFERGRRRWAGTRMQTHLRLAPHRRGVTPGAVSVSDTNTRCRKIRKYKIANPLCRPLSVRLAYDATAPPASQEVFVAVTN